MGRVGQGWAYGVLKTDLRFEDREIHSKGLGTNLGQGEVGIGVPVRCYTECNSTTHVM